MRKRFLQLVFALIFQSASHAQRPDWQHLDLAKDSVFGMSTDKAYRELLQNKKPDQVIVAVIDSGTDTAHIDLKQALWTNTREIPGNGVDDDQNGYIDDLHGWNYIATESGREDLVNIIAPRKDFYDSLSYTIVPASERKNYQAYRKILDEYAGHVSNAKSFLSDLERCSKILDSILKKIGKDQPSRGDLKNYKPQTELEEKVVEIILDRLPHYPDFKQFRKYEVEIIMEKLQSHLQNGLNLPSGTYKQPLLQTGAGDGMICNEALGLVISPNTTSYHGTHITGIIAATRHNQKGMDGVADNVKIMTLKLISNIRELRDENLALAIRYAADNGAKIINLSFGKPFSYGKSLVDQAVKYAMNKDVLIVCAAGNTGEDLDNTSHFPNPVYADKSGMAQAWIEVGASGPKDDNTLAASFSNYGYRSVDVFAPGVQIYSCIPGSAYISADGTSMATPMVAGLAALIREYYPKLKAAQVKDIIMKSVVKRDILKDKCVSGGVVNAYNALKLAATYK